MSIYQFLQKHEIGLWLKRLGWLGLLISLARGAVWLTLPLLSAYA